MAILSRRIWTGHHKRNEPGGRCGRSPSRLRIYWSCGEKQVPRYDRDDNRLGDRSSCSSGHKRSRLDVGFLLLFFPYGLRYRQDSLW